MGPLAKILCGVVVVLAVSACGGSSGQLENPATDSDPSPNTWGDVVSAPKPAPVGMYNSAGGVSASTPALVTESVNALDYVAGTLVRVSWDAIHLAPGVFDFSLLDREFEAAANLNTAIELAILDAKETPSFVAAACETFDYSFRGEPEQTCLPWDTEYLFYKEELIAALGARYDNLASLSAIYFSYAAMTNGIEMHWRVDETAFAAAGYTQERLLGAYNAVMDIYIAAFPLTPVIMEVHEVFDDGYLAENAFLHCYDQIGERCGVAMWWCAERLTRAPGGESDVWPTAMNAVNLSFAVCQTVGNFTEQPDRFDDGAGWTSQEAIENEMNFFFSQGVQVWELWSQDIVNSEFAETIRSINAQLERSP